MPRLDLDLDHVKELRELQAGVLSRDQVLSAGGEPHDLRRLVRRRELAPLGRGIYLDHTGEPTWQQRAWAAVLAVAPAALDGRSALRAACGPKLREGERDDAPIDVAVALSRSLAPPPGVRLIRRTHLDAIALSNTSPPRVRVEHAVLHVVAGQSRTSDKLEWCAAVVRRRATTAARILAALEAERRLPGRADLRPLLEDLRDGTQSVLEHGYLTNVERPHGLPQGTRQLRQSTVSGRVYRDVDYQPFGTIVELDGRLHLEPQQRRSDLKRDVKAHVQGRITLRLGHEQVFDEPCITTGDVAAVLRQRGWPSAPSLCGPGCLALASLDGAHW